MEKKLVKKMIINCFKQYYEADSMPIGEEDLEELSGRILKKQKEEPKTDLFEVVNDVIYEFLTS
ncbi:YqzH family protein [Neobacillus fumarioli]|uniref:YqzH family protein n=1 Tax=Neobacillus fumarioli TaxID=105229 RepID=UPI00082959A7|nr:YqzH family protein [Neobacillus fumarioli]